MIVGLSGFARSGKDAIAKILVEEHGFTRLAFADPIRELLLQINPILSNGKRLNEVIGEIGWENAKAQTEVRRLLQDTGVGARTVMGEQVWVVPVMMQMIIPGDFVITDVRFENEANMIKDFGGEVWRVTRDGVSAVNDHISEASLIDYSFDHIIENNGTLEDLRGLLHEHLTGVALETKNL